jgi:hypothetical protein
MDTAPRVGRARGAGAATLLTLAVVAVPAGTIARESATPSPDVTDVPSAEPVAIVSEQEPGQPLRIEGRVLDAETSRPITGAVILVYQTDDGGEYEPADRGDESTARIRGELTSDEDGRFAFRTILPGEYPGQPPGNRHIHVHSVEAPGYAPTGFVILFDDNVRDDVRSWAAETGFGQVIETSSAEGVLRGSVEIQLTPLAPGPSAVSAGPAESPAQSPG